MYDARDKIKVLKCLTNYEGYFEMKLLDFYCGRRHDKSLFYYISSCHM